MRFAKYTLSLQRVKFLTARQKYEKKARLANVEQIKIADYGNKKVSDVYTPTWKFGRS